MSKGVTLPSQTGIFNDDIREWIRQFSALKMSVKYKFFPSSASRTEKKGNNSRKMGVHRDSTKHIWCTAALFKRLPWGDWRHTKNRAGNADTRLRDGRTGTRQCSPYQINLRGNGTVGTDHCDHKCHVGATKNTCLCTNQPIEYKKKVLLLDLREQFHLREQKLLSKETVTSRGIVPQEKNGWQRDGM